MHKEQETVKKMIELYCRGNHASGQELCAECGELLAYARKRLEMCKYGKEKPACSKCPVHCYKPLMREKIILVMRYAGPRMIFAHPAEAVRHLLKEKGLR